MDKMRAIEIIKEHYPYENFKPITTEDLLEDSKGSDYRPYYVAANLIKTEYRRVTRIEETYMEYPEDAINYLLELQIGKDKSISDIPDHHKIILSVNDENSIFVIFTGRDRCTQ